MNTDATMSAKRLRPRGGKAPEGLRLSQITPEMLREYLLARTSRMPRSAKKARTGMADLEKARRDINEALVREYATFLEFAQGNAPESACTRTQLVALNRELRYGPLRVASDDDDVPDSDLLRADDPFGLVTLAAAARFDLLDGVIPSDRRLAALANVSDSYVRSERIIRSAFDGDTPEQRLVACAAWCARKGILVRIPQGPRS
jgi:hypothetical protein